MFISYIGTDSIGSLIKRFAAKKAGVEDGEEINNQRKAFLDMLAWSEELITDVRKPEIMVMTSLWAKAILLITPITLRKLVTLNPKLKSTGAGRYDFFPVGGMPTASSLA